MQIPVTTLPLPGQTSIRPTLTSIATVRIGHGRDTTAYADRELLFNPFAAPVATFKGSLSEAVRGATQLLKQTMMIPEERFALGLVSDAKTGAWVARRVISDQLGLRGIDGGPGIHSFSFQRAMPGLGAVVTNLGARQLPTIQ